MTRSLRLFLALCLVAGVVLLHREVLLSGMVYHMDDAADGYYPSHAAIWRAFREGRLPDWERGAWCGFPLLADPYYGAFYPLSITFYALGLVRGLGFNIALHSLLGAAGMFLLLRRRRLPPGPALLGACALGLSSFMVERIRHIIFPQLLSWLPWVLFFAEGYLQAEGAGARRRALFFLALCLGLTLLCGALPLLPFCALTLSAYLLPRWLAAPRRGAALAGLGLAGLIGLGIGMAQLVPTLAHLPHSPRQLGADYAFASSYAWPDLRYLATLIAPDIFGGADRGSWRGAYNHWEMAGWYVGALTVVFAPLGLLRLRGRPELVSLGLCSLLAVALAFGDAAPVHRWFFHHVPIYAALRCPVRALVMFLLCAPILAAEGLTWLMERLSGHAAAARRRWIVAAAGVLGGGLLLFWSLRGVAGKGLPRLPVAPTFFAALGHLGLCLAAGGAVLLLVRGGVLSGLRGGLLLALCTLVDLVLVGRGYVQPRPADFAPGTERFAAVEWLLQQRPAERFAIDATGPFRLHNLGLTYGLESASGYDSYSIWRYVHFLHVLNTGAPYPYRQLHHDPAAGDVRRFDSPLVDLLNVRWFIGPHQPAPGWIERFRPLPGRLSARYEPLWDPLLRVYENPHPLPRAFVVYRAEVLPDDAAQAQALSRLDPRERVLLEQAPVPAPAGPPGGGPSFTPARLLSTDRHHLLIETETESPGVLVVSEAHYPGWRATLDGTPVPLLRADYAFRGVAVPAGRHRVELRFHSRPAQLGLLLSLLGLLAGLGLGFAAIAGRRRLLRPAP